MRTVFIVLARLLGLLQVYWGLAYLAPVGLRLGLPLPPGLTGTQAMLWLAVLLVYVLLAFGMAWVLLFHTVWLAEKLGIEADAPAPTFTQEIVLPVGLKLIGVYFLVDGIAGLVRTLMHVAIDGPWHFRHAAVFWTELLPTLLLIVMALVLAIRTRWILSLLARGEKGRGSVIIIAAVALLVVLVLLVRYLTSPMWY